MVEKWEANNQPHLMLFGALLNKIIAHVRAKGRVKIWNPRHNKQSLYLIEPPSATKGVLPLALMREWDEASVPSETDDLTVDVEEKYF